MENFVLIFVTSDYKMVSLVSALFGLFSNHSLSSAFVLVWYGDWEVDGVVVSVRIGCFLLWPMLSGGWRNAMKIWCPQLKVVEFDHFRISGKQPSGEQPLSRSFPNHSQCIE